MVETARERFEQVQGLFRSSREALPQEIVSTLTDACGIRQVLIKELEVHDNELDYISCTLQMTEFESVENQLKTQAQQQEAAAEAEQRGEEAIAGDEKLNEALGNPEGDYLSQRYEQGKTDAIGEDSPALLDATSMCIPSVRESGFLPVSPGILRSGCGSRSTQRRARSTVPGSGSFLVTA